MREQLLEAFADLRVADVRDGMDTLLHHVDGSLDPGIRPLWRTRAFGIARTVRYVAWDGAVPRLSPDEYWQWSGTYYRDICPYPWVDEIEPGDFVIIDQSGVNAGLMGSENTLACLRKGARGFVSNGGVRDTDEVILQKVPFWSAFCSQSMVQGRLAYADRNVPVIVGGVRVCPGDMVVADGDGVIVVPRDIALDVAYQANEEHRRDMKARRAHYDALGMKADKTVADSAP
jgi:4-hydroxy-4-methyl-2-oxoglutarate aldolase